MSDELKQRVSDGRVWRRGGFMLLFGFLLGPVKFLVILLAVFQFLNALFTGSINARVARFGNGLAVYLYQITAFLTGDSELRPFPFADWPQGVSLVEVEEMDGGMR